MIAEIRLTRGYCAVIDAKDLPIVAGYSWHASVERGRVYAKARVPGENRYVKLHRLLLGEPDALVDHRDGDTLNCQRANLRACSAAQNIRNSTKRSDSTSPFKGVERRGNVWRARIREGSRYRSIGHFSSASEAARAYDDAARQLHGEFACVNFPIESERSAEAPRRVAGTG